MNDEGGLMLEKADGTRINARRYHHDGSDAAAK
jgi:hypothetical protein